MLWPPGQGPQAAVLPRGLLDGEPEAGDGPGLGPEEGLVGVAGDLAADPGLLEDVHRLQDRRVLVAQVGAQFGQRRGVAETLEDRVQVVHGVAQLVDRQRLGLAQLAIGRERLLLEEEPGLVPGGEEVLVAVTGLLVGGEDRPHALVGLEVVDQGLGPPLQLGARRLGHEVPEHQEPVPLVVGPLLGAQHQANVARCRGDDFSVPSLEPTGDWGLSARRRGGRGRPSRRGRASPPGRGGGSGRPARRGGTARWGGSGSRWHRRPPRGRAGRPPRRPG